VFATLRPVGDSSLSIRDSLPEFDLESLESFELTPGVIIPPLQVGLVLIMNKLGRKCKIDALSEYITEKMSVDNVMVQELKKWQKDTEQNKEQTGDNIFAVVPEAEDNFERQNGEEFWEVAHKPLEQALLVLYQEQLKSPKTV